MKTHLLKTVLLGLALLANFAALGQTAKKPAAPEVKPAPVRSVFILPTHSSDGRDPFFPESGRVYQAMASENSTHSVEISTLAVKGFYRDAKSAFVIINNHTFAVGDEGDVLTPGGRVHIRCMEIRSAVVIIDVNGSKHELLLNTAK
jgi:hypothetical protein